MSWEEVVFESVFKIPTKNGLTKPSRIRGEGFKFINMGELFAIDRMFDPEMELVPLTESEKISHKIEAGDLLFARQSLVASGAGKCSIVKEVDDLTVFDSHIIRVRLNQEQCYPDFYYYYFKSTVNNLKSLVQQGVQAGIKASDLSKLKVHLPPLQTQKRIASILSAYDDLIENNLKRIKLLEETAQNIYKEWFVNFRFPNYEHTPINQETGLPEGWEKKKLNDIYSIKYGKNLPTTLIKSDGKFKVYGASGVMGYYDQSNVFIKVALITSRGNGSGDIHRTYEQESFVTNNSFIVLPKEEYTEIPFYFTLESLKRLNLKNYCSGSAQPQLTNASMNNIDIDSPPFVLVNKYKNITNPIYELIDKIVIQNQKLKEARDILLPRLMNRKIEV